MIRQTARRLLEKSPRLDGLFRRLVWSRVHFPEHELRVLDALPKDHFDVAVDIGAALGSYTWVLNRKARSVLAFEPGSQHFAHVDKARMLSRVHVINAAVGAEAGTAELLTPGATNDGRHMATLSAANPVTETADLVRDTVQVVALDSFLGQTLEPGRRVDLIKIDVEGFENAVLSGARARIAADHPVIIAEVEARHNPEYTVFFETLLELGYECLAYSGGAYVPFSAQEVGAQVAPSHFPEGGEHRVDGYINNFVFQHPQSAAKVLSL